MAGKCAQVAQSRQPNVNRGCYREIHNLISLPEETGNISNLKWKYEVKSRALSALETVK